MKKSLLSYYERKSAERLKGVAQWLGLELQQSSWDYASHEYTLSFVALPSECQEFIRRASRTIRKAQYACVPGGVKVKFLSTAKDGCILQGTQNVA